MSPPPVEIRPGQPGNEPAFGPAYEAAGGRARLGRALGEVYEDGPGWVQQFGGVSGRPAVICARFRQSAVAVDQEVWDALAQFGRGTYVSGVAAVGFPVPAAGRAFVTEIGALVRQALKRMASDFGFTAAPEVASVLGYDIEAALEDPDSQ